MTPECLGSALHPDGKLTDTGSTMRANERDPIFLIGLGDQHDGLAHRLNELGYRPLRAEEPMGAAMLLSRTERPVRGAIIPVEDEFLDRAGELAKLAEKCLGLSYIVCGKEPEPAAIDGLRRDGVRYCLWDGFSDHELRFVVNRALYDRTRGDVRDRTRVPTGLSIRMRNSAGERSAGLYNLSCTGAFLDTQRSSLPGGRMILTLPLPTGDLSLQAKVVSANVPGNLKRENLPMGMGVTFFDVEAEQQARLEQFVAQRARSYEL